MLALAHLRRVAYYTLAVALDLQVGPCAWSHQQRTFARCKWASSVYHALVVASVQEAAACGHSLVTGCQLKTPLKHANAASHVHSAVWVGTLLLMRRCAGSDTTQSHHCVALARLAGHSVRQDSVRLVLRLPAFARSPLYL